MRETVIIRGLLAGLAMALTACPSPTAAAPDAQIVPGSLDASNAGRFVAVPGERAVVMGYPDAGLEVWAWPLQLLSGYQLRFHEAGRVEPLEGRALLSRIEYRASEVVRVYVGPDFVVRERLFTPLHEPGAILTYEVSGRPDVQVEARFQPSLNLMWPGGLGGQEVGWDEARSGYVEREPLHGFNATIRSPQAVAHEPTANSASARPDGLALLLQPRREADGVARARLFVAADPPQSSASKAPARPPLAQALERRDAALRDEAAAHAATLQASTVEITTPDPELNRALAAATLALDQAWVCTPELGCGEVAGYGPSRPGRRPQYAWFFAGDGLVAVEGLLASGRFERAREELEFIARYQNKTNGMIWHEMSLSAPLIDWEKRYPYMFVHVDITLQYLSTLAQYVEATGDRDFLAAHWPGVQAAWRYARALVDPATGLPAIPPGKQGQNEQDKLRDDVRLSSAWIDAADGFAAMAHATGREGLAREGETAARTARAAVRATGWDVARGFWLGGHTLAGAAVHDERSDAMRLVLQDAFTPAQADAALDRLSGPAFQTDWGVRSLSADAPNYDPNAYGAGSVWALGTSAAATTFYRAHRPQAAWGAWHGLQAWTALDAPGHLHEVLAGDLFHPERESVPEQTWSSAGFLVGAVGGLLGLEPHARARTLTFAPHLPGAWREVEVRRVRVGASRLDLHMTQDAGAVTLEIANDGAPVTVEFSPEIPLGARLLGAQAGGAPDAATLEVHAQDQHARLRVIAAHGTTRATVRYEGGVRLAPVTTAPRPGDASVNLKLASVAWIDGALHLRAYVADAGHAAIDLDTAMRVTAVQGAEVAPRDGGGYRLTLRSTNPPATPPVTPGYAPVDTVVRFAP